MNNELLFWGDLFLFEWFLDDFLCSFLVLFILLEYFFGASGRQIQDKFFIDIVSMFERMMVWYEGIWLFLLDKIFVGRWERDFLVDDYNICTAVFHTKIMKTCSLVFHLKPYLTLHF